jgi:spore cortex formation protein SpoVR/YcgB (stage V sporulation)
LNINQGIATYFIGKKASEVFNEGIATYFIGKRCHSAGI